MAVIYNPLLTEFTIMDIMEILGDTYMRSEDQNIVIYQYPLPDFDGYIVLHLILAKRLRGDEAPRISKAEYWKGGSYDKKEHQKSKHGSP